MTTLAGLAFAIDDVDARIRAQEGNTPLRVQATAYQFLDSLGVCGRMVDTTGDYGNVTSVMSCMTTLGLWHMRTASPIPGGQGRTAIQTMAAAGIKFTFTIRVFNTSGHETTGRTIADQVGWIDSLEASYPGSVVGIEGPNEVNNQTLPNLDYATWDDFQDAVVAEVVASTHLSTKPVLGYTDTSWYDTSGDIANVHDYPRNGDMLTKAGIYAADGQGVGKFMTITETGFGNSTTSTPFAGTDSTTQAKLILNAICEGPAAGLDRTFIYQLLDPFTPGTSMEDYFGLFSHPYTTKPAGTALANFVTLVEDLGGTAQTHSNLPAMVYSTSTAHKWLTFARSDGSTVVILWQTGDIWNQTSKTPIALTPLTVPVTIAGSFTSIDWYDPMVDTNSQGSFSTASFNLTVGDSPIILVIR